MINKIQEFNEIIKNKENLNYFFCSFLKHKDFITKLIHSVENAIQSHNLCKDYYYTLKIPNTNLQKNYSKNTIISIFHPSLNKNKIIENNFDEFDILYMTYFSYKKYFEKIYHTLQNVYLNHHQVKDFQFKFELPKQIFIEKNINPLILTSEEFIKLHKISFILDLDLPIPNKIKS